jgi:hypothetical protein
MAYQVPVDKKLHFIGGNIIYIANEKYPVFKHSITPVVLIGLGKEILDENEKGNKFDFNDLLFTTLGGIFIKNNF